MHVDKSSIRFVIFTNLSHIITIQLQTESRLLVQFERASDGEWLEATDLRFIVHICNNFDCVAVSTFVS